MANCLEVFLPTHLRLPLPAMWETRVQSWDREDPLEKRMATHSGILAWRIPQRSLSCYSPWGHKELDMTE